MTTPSQAAHGDACRPLVGLVVWVCGECAAVNLLGTGRCRCCRCPVDDRCYTIAGAAPVDAHCDCKHGPEGHYFLANSGAGELRCTRCDA